MARIKKRPKKPKPKPKPKKPKTAEALPIKRPKATQLRVKNVNWIPHGPLTGAKKRKKR